MPSPPPLAAVLLLLLAGGAGAARYAEAPHFRNGRCCPRGRNPCDPSHIHIAMTLDASYLRGSIAGVHSLLKHTSCPSLLFFHFVSSGEVSDLRAAVLSAFPSLRFRIYPFSPSPLISPSVRSALEDPLNYARTYLADLLPPCVRRAVYLDSDVVVVDDIRSLWDSTAASGAVVAAPEYCHANFTGYFTPAFWDGPGARVFAGRRRAPCYFNTGVMVMDLVRWRKGEYTRRIEMWMRKQRERRIYELGSLPPYLLVFAGDVEAVEHRWNQHGLGGDNVAGSCRELHPGPASLLHWSGKGKPWDRLDAGRPCPIDGLWAPYICMCRRRRRRRRRRLRSLLGRVRFWRERKTLAFFWAAPLPAMSGSPPRAAAGLYRMGS